jgi:hypothetical protein
MAGALEDLRAVAHLVRRLPPPYHRNPEAFHIARDALAREIEIIAERLERGER